MVTPASRLPTRRLVEAAGLVAEHQGHRSGPVEGHVVGAAPHDGGHRREPETPSAPTAVRGAAALHHRHVEQRAGRGPHALRIGRVDGAVAAHHGVDPGGVRRPDDGAQVAGVAHVDAHDDEGGAGQARRAGSGRTETTASRGWGVTVEATRSITPGARSKTRPPPARTRSVTVDARPARRPLGGDVDGLDVGAGGQRHRQQFRPLDHHDLLGGPQAPPLRRSWRSLRTRWWVKARPDWVRNRPRRSQAAVARASLATCTSEANASGAVTARSARTLRSTSTSARCRPAMKRL